MREGGGGKKAEGGREKRRQKNFPLLVKPYFA